MIGIRLSDPLEKIRFLLQSMQCMGFVTKTATILEHPRGDVKRIKYDDDDGGPSADDTTATSVFIYDLDSPCGSRGSGTDWHEHTGPRCGFEYVIDAFDF